MLILDPKEIKQKLPDGYVFLDLSGFPEEKLDNFKLIKGEHIVFYQHLLTGEITKSIPPTGRLRDNYSAHGYYYAIAQKGEIKPRFKCDKPYPWGY